VDEANFVAAADNMEAEEVTNNKNEEDLNPEDVQKAETDLVQETEREVRVTDVATPTKEPVRRSTRNVPIVRRSDITPEHAEVRR
jgi:hypothetical protein